MPDRRLHIRIGETEIAEGILSLRFQEAADNVVSVDIVFSSDALADSNPDYQAEVRLFAAAGSERETLFTGMVDAVTPRGGETEVRLVSGQQMLNETQTEGLGIGAGIGVLETVWSLLRTWGVEADQISFPEFRPPLEVFEVATALDGIEVSEPTSIGEVRLLPSGTVSRLANDLGPDYLRERYSGASAWALSLQTARTIFDAESQGLKAIDLALAWLTARAQFSGAAMPGGHPRRFQRAWTLSRVSRRDVIVVRGTATGRRWLRSPIDIPDRPTFALNQSEDLEVVPLPPNLPIQIREALSAWRRAAEETDSLAAVMALWEAVEFYTSGVEAPKMFQKATLKSIRRQATAGLEGEQLRRVKDMVSRLNEPPLMVRLRVALDEDQVPYEDAELSLLQRLRGVRNDLVHGRSRETPSAADLRYAKAIVNRMLVYRVSRLTRPTLGATEI